MQIPEIDFSTLDFREIGTWPFILRVALIAVVAIISIVLTYFLIIESSIEVLDSKEAELATKLNEFKEKYNMAVNLDAYKRQMVEMNVMYKDYLKALPSSSGIPELIDNISRLGDKNNLKISSIKIGDPKVASGFYMELPIDFVISGLYNNIGMFISDLSKLPRIVTVEDFAIKPSGVDGGANSSGILTMNLSTKTYWVADTIEQQPTDANSSKKPLSTVPAAGASSPRPITPSSEGAIIPPPSKPGGG